MSIITLLLFPSPNPSIILSGLPKNHVFFILNLLPQPLNFSSHIMPYHWLIFHRCFVKAKEACFLAAGLSEREFFCVSSCTLRGRLACQSISVLTREMRGNRLSLRDETSLSDPLQASDFLSETFFTV